MLLHVCVRIAELRENIKPVLDESKEPVRVAERVEPGILVRQRYNVAMSAHCHKSVPILPLGLSHNYEAQCCLTRPLVSSSGAVIVAVL